MNADASKESGSYAADSLLGKQAGEITQYDPSLLHAILRSDYRQTIDGRDSGIHVDVGVDVWRCYELSWLNNKGKPEVRAAQITFSASSSNIVESKSLKLYLNSLNNHQFESEAALKATIITDLQRALDTQVVLVLAPIESNGFALFDANESAAVADIVYIDDTDVECQHFQREPALLKTENHSVSEQKLVSHVLRSFCPVTHQPDWATLTIKYSGKALNVASLLQYIVSYRNHKGFHEQCIEQIFVDLQLLNSFDSLTVVGQFTRRGGIDINPYRSTEAGGFSEPRVNRQ